MLSFIKRTCRLCGGRGNEFVCSNCINTELRALCSVRLRAPLRIDALYSPYCYDRPMGHLLKRSKEQNNIMDSWALRESCDGWSNEFCCNMSWDFIIPIPPRMSSLQNRGFDLPMIFADSISRASRGNDLRREERLLLKWRTFRSDSPQKFLSQKERSSNLSSSFRTASIDLHGKSVLIVDDVVCTGATLLEAAHAISKLNPDRIEAFCLAHSHQSAISRLDERKLSRETKRDHCRITSP